jgi:phosphoribosylanthranilate isomerase
MRIKVKICGITRLEDAKLALALGADEIGFILAPSPRRVEPETVRTILEALKGDGGLHSSRPTPSFGSVGVFVNETSDAMRDIMIFAGLDAAQIHGDETPETCAGFDFPWFRALRINGVDEANRLVGAQWRCPRLLVDSAARGMGGGTGDTIGTWAALAAGALARGAGKGYFVAGGVRPRNVANFIHSLSPDGLDVSSGVEEAPGRKSAGKLEDLFREIGLAEAARGSEEVTHAAR